jgi:hypothetical protein
MTWLDARGADAIARRARGRGLNIEGYGPLKLWRWLRLSGGAPSLSGRDSAGHIAWLHDHEPERCARTHKFLNVPDYLNLRLTGRFCATQDSALTSWVTDNRDSRHVRYDAGLIRLLGVDADKLPEIVRGPLSLMDTMGFLVGCGRGHTHGVIFKNAVKHPGHFFRNPEAGGGIEYTGIGHHRESTAKEVGVPGVYDYGPQRSAWMASLVTNWMGDAGFLKRIKTRMSRFNTMGDCTWARGTVVKKYIKDGHALVDIEIKGENQRGELTTPGLATVVLPSLDPNIRAFVDGSNLDLELPVVR